MDKRILLVLTLLLIPSVAAQLETSDLYKHSYLVLDTTIESDLVISPESSDYATDYILVKLFFAPIEDERLEVLSFKASPDGKKRDGAIEYRWENPEYFNLDYRVDSKVKTKTIHNIIPNKVGFPLLEVPGKWHKYTQRTDNSDFEDANIRKLANDLAKGEDDLYIVSNKAAIWVRDNIQYNLSTVTAQASKPASWVLRNRRGVCDELTNLYIALMRSLGVPARFVSGIAYTNSPLFAQKWGPHGWAEVWFPDYGWVPFDPTYGQFGWLDPSHVKLRESLDASDPSTKFEWRGRNVDLDVNQLDFDVEILEKGQKVDYKININSQVLKPSVGFSSHNVIKSTVENLNNYYLTTDITLANTQGLELLSPQQQTVILKPYETAELFWTVQVKDSLKDNFLYTFPVLAYDLRNVSSVTSFTVSRGEPVFSRQDADRFVRLTATKEEKTLTQDVGIECNVKEVLAIAQDNKITCTLTNKGNTVLPSISVCKSSFCSGMKLNIGETKDMQFRISKKEPGKYVEPITVDWGFSKTETEVYYTLIDKPTAIIENVIAPAEVGFNQEFAIEFTLKQKSFAHVPNGKTQILMDGHKIQEWSFPNLDQEHSYKFKMKGSDLKAGKNEFTLKAFYDTKDGKVTTQQKFTVALTNLSAAESIVSWMNRIGLWIAGIFS